MLGLDSITYVPLNDAVNQIVFAENGESVRDVMVDGRMVVKDGQVTNVDMEKLRAEVEASVMRQIPARDAARETMEKLAVHVGPFCAGFAAQEFAVNRFVGGK